MSNVTPFRAPAPRPRGGAARDRLPPLDLALQGGGSHGAFTWGVLDRLLEDEGLQFDGVSGTSAGAMNAAVLATGWAAGGREGARSALRAFWMDVAGAGGCFGHWPALPTPSGLAAAGALTQSAWTQAALWPWTAIGVNPMAWWLQQLSRVASPAQFNPLDLNILRDIVRRHVQLPALQQGPLQLFITATRVRTGQPRVFHRGNLTHEALLASACLPQLFRAVEIDGEPYWDGGYAGNPALWPLIYKTSALDLLLVKIDPLQRAGTPDTVSEISDRVNEITFSAPLAGEMRAIAFVRRLIEDGRLDAGQYKRLRLHMVADETRLGTLPASTKLQTDREFLLKLSGWGRDAAEAWLAAHRQHIGVESTLPLEDTFLPPSDDLG